MIAMELNLDEQTEALIKGIAETSDSKPSEVVKEAVESQAEELGKQLLMQQGAQKMQQELQTEELNTGDEE